MNLDAANMSPLADIKGVRLLTRKSDDAIYKMSDGGDLVEGSYQWVWNVATNARGTIPDLRWWIGEVVAAKRQADLTLAQVINFILPPHRREFPAGEVRSLLLVSRPTLMELRAELLGDLRDGGSFYPRPGLVKFFTKRWLGAATNFATDKAAPLHTMTKPSDPALPTSPVSSMPISRVGNSRSTGSPSQKLSSSATTRVPTSPATPKQNRNGFKLPAPSSPTGAGQFSKEASC
ncbi:MAG: hypothetical protein WCH99_04945 [Verrucomicrobiota bacterium]